jgi:hypothetical protein
MKTPVKLTALDLLLVEWREGLFAPIRKIVLFLYVRIMPFGHAKPTAA